MVRLAALIGVLLLAACGGGGGGGGGPPPVPQVLLSGTATYDRVPVGAGGLAYAGTVARPARGIIVQVRSADGITVLSQASTADDGSFTISAPQAQSIVLAMVSQLGGPGAITTRVVDNQDGDALYAAYIVHATGTADETGLALHAPSGWTGAGYDPASRVGGAFAILDTVRSAQDLVRSADAAAGFPLLTIGWSAGNTVAAIGTSFYQPSSGRLFLLGGEDEDTDEYDTHVVAHEWGHWFEGRFSRSDSVGGAHGSGDILDETVAFGEGWGNAFSGMANADRYYRDSSGAGQAAAYTMDLESDAIGDAVTHGATGVLLDGAWSEGSVQEILWDLFDGAGVASADGETVALGFAPLYQVFTGAQRTTPAFTSIHSFLYALEAARPADAAAIAALAAAENIGAHDAFEQTARKRYTVLPSDGSTVTVDVDGDPLTTYDAFGPIDGDYMGNKYYNRLFFKAVAPSAGTWRIRVVPVDPAHDVIIFRGGGRTPAWIDGVYGGTEQLDFSASAGQTLTFAVGSFANAANPSGVTPFTIRFGTPTTVSKPSPEPIVAVPRSDG